MSDKILIKRKIAYEWAWECPECGCGNVDDWSPNSAEDVTCGCCGHEFSPDDFGSEILEEGD